MPRVLLVEDDLAERYALRRHLTHAGIKVVVFGTAESALQALESTPSIQLIVTDLKLGTAGAMSGADLVAAARAAGRTLKAIYVTGHAFVSPDGDAVLQKPFDEQMLIRLIEQTLEATA